MLVEEDLFLLVFPYVSLPVSLKPNRLQEIRIEVYPFLSGIDCGLEYWKDANGLSTYRDAKY